MYSLFSNSFATCNKLFTNESSFIFILFLFLKLYFKFQNNCFINTCINNNKLTYGKFFLRIKFRNIFYNFIYFKIYSLRKIKI